MCSTCAFHHHDPAPCSVDGCNTPSHCRGWCQKHYTRWYRYHDPLLSGQPLGSSLIANEYQRTDGRWVVKVKGRYVLRNRAVMAASIGRDLLPSEIVHHRNENPTDDRIENLELLSRYEHRQRHPQMHKPATYTFDPAYLRERLLTTSRTKLAAELGCNPWVFRRILQEI